MLTGKDLDKKLEIEKFVEEYTTLYFSTIDLSDYMYLDEVYTSIAEKIDRIKTIGEVRYSPIDEYDFVEENVFTDFTSDYKTISEINYRMIPELYSGLQSIADNIMNISSSLNKITYNSQVTMKAVEEEIKAKLLMQTIKEENTIYDSIGPGTKLISNTTSNTHSELTVNEQSRNVTLPIIKAVEVPFEITISVNKDKGSYLPTAYGDKSFENITNGYFYSRMFAQNPKLEVEDIDGNISSIMDGNPETGLAIEYNSIIPDDTFIVSFQLDFEESKIDNINIIFEPLGSESVIGLNNTYPILSKLHIEGNGEIPISEDIEKLILNNIIEIDGRKVGDYDTGVNYSGKESFPSAAYIINTEAISSISLEYTSSTPQEIYYPEKVVYDYRDMETYRFNYFETLVLNGYVVPADRAAAEGETDIPSDPYSYYDKEDIISMKEILSSAYMTIDQKIKMYRYMIGVKDIKLYKHIYAPIGTTITDNLIPSGKKAAAVELYVNENIPDRCSIKYYISPDGSSWVDLIPKNRTTESTRGKRVVFAGFNPSSGDVVVNTEAPGIYMKIEMKGTETITPILNAYSLKVKYI